MATPKEQRDARPNARNIGPAHARARPADSTPPGGIRAVTLQDLMHAGAPDTPLVAAPVGAAPIREPAEPA